MAVSKGLTDVAALFERKEDWADAYRHTPRRAMGARTEAFEFKRTLEPNNPDGSMAMQNANFRVELASMKFREALRAVVSALARRSD